MKQRGWIIVSVIVIVTAGLIALGILNNSNGSQGSGSDVYTGEGNPEAFASIYDRQPAKGENDAPVKIVEFGDYQCPACKQFHDGLLPVIEENFVDTGKAQFYFMDYPFLGPDSTTTAFYAEAVYSELGDEAFWTFQHEIFARQGEDGSVPSSVDVIQELFNEEEAEQVLNAYEEGSVKDTVGDERKFAEDNGVTGTPSVFINGKAIDMSKLKTIDDLNQVIEAAAASNN
ncbi:thioredoxin domain-containing protein [Bacillaceae bacterium SIJ1]|uniref:DsbA family protein n=1 Tax=Litoribacterium kuwaitense TaxID=1398745 RepID=UPI0013ED67BD|nr:thioredoxin domain-containing protein [Litoribacterium kuwaitense]NGP46042.1 thioredoxin domain-containing protein [Litoribacterium kuwaitense]